MFQKRQKVNIDDTRFIYQTNFSGDPARDRFGSDKRRVNIVIPTVEQARQMMNMGIKVKETKPNPNYTYCLLYTSDAADEEDSVDLGGRRIIKKKKK